MTLPSILRGGPRFADSMREYLGYVTPFLRRVEPWYLRAPMGVLKTVEFSVYRWYKPQVTREYVSSEVRELIYKITNRCTDRCAKCGIWRNPDGDRVPIEVVERCVSDLAKRLGAFTITGGEPLLYHDEVCRLARLSTTLDVPMTVVTNGVLLDDDVLNELNRGRHTLVISLDTLSPSRWIDFRGRDNMEVVLGNVTHAIRRLGKRVKIQSVLAQETADELPAVAEMCRMAGIDHFVQPYMDFGGHWTPAQAREPKSAGGCAAWRNLCILTNGDVVRCFDHTRLPYAVDPLGNLRADSIQTILSHQRTAEVTSTMRACRLPCRQLSCNRSQS